MLGSFRIERRGAGSKIGFDHVGDDGARLGKSRAATAGSI